MTDMMYENLLYATLESLYLVSISTILVSIFGVLLGLLLFCTSKNQIYENKVIYNISSVITNIIRAIPFIILVIILLPVTKFLVGTILGPNAAIPALVIGMAPFYGKIIETCLKDIPFGIIEVAKSEGYSNLQIICKVLIPESIHSILANLTTMCIAILSYSTVSGIIGAGGLGNLAYIEGFQRNNNLVTLYATLIIIIMVFIIQFAGNKITQKLDKKGL